jgi:hypothetical protein
MACVGDGRNVYTVLLGKTERKRALGKPWNRWQDGIRMYIRETVRGWAFYSLGLGW